MPKSPVYKFRDIFNRIGRKKHNDDPIKVVIYIALTEYIDTIEAVILHEREYITEIDSGTDENHNETILEISKIAKDLLDKSLHLSLWGKEVGKEAETMVRKILR